MTTTFNNVSGYDNTSDYYQQRAWDFQEQFDLSFNIDDPGHNDSVDAFRHTFMNAMFAYKYNSDVAKKIGDLHEWTGNNEFAEKYMDLWNNYMGRKIGESLKTDPNISGMTDQQIEEYAAQKIYEKYLNGDLIADPDDISQFNKPFNIDSSSNNLIDPVRRVGFNPPLMKKKLVA